MSDFFGKEEKDIKKAAKKDIKNLQALNDKFDENIAGNKVAKVKVDDVFKNNSTKKMHKIITGIAKREDDNALSELLLPFQIASRKAIEIDENAEDDKDGKLKLPKGIKLDPVEDPEAGKAELFVLDQDELSFNATGLVRRSIEQEILKFKTPFPLELRITNNGSKEFEFILRSGGLEDRQTIAIGETAVFEVPKKNQKFQLDLTRGNDNEDDKIPYDFDIQLAKLGGQVIDDLADLIGLGLNIDGRFTNFKNEEIIVLPVPTPVAIKVTDLQAEQGKTVKLNLFKATKKNKPNLKQEIIAQEGENASPVQTFVINEAGTFVVVLTPLQDGEDIPYDFKVELAD